MQPVESAPNPGSAFAAALVSELARSGVRHVCVCPGSRSALLALAAAAEPGLRCWSQVDERSAAFFGLGLAKASRAPVALVCTSGTAAANFLPAVVEAHYARVPLVVLTADRPPELREWGAGQTIDQLRLFGTHVRWFAEAALPEDGDAILRYARALACRAVAEAAGPPAGPVHLNLPFRDPLDPRARPRDVEALSALARRGRGADPYTRSARRARLPAPDEVDRWAAVAAQRPRGLIACGPHPGEPDLGEAVALLAEATGWPILAEPTSQLRCGSHCSSGAVLGAADLFLRDRAFADSVAPDLVLRIGAPPTSKVLREWLERRPPRELWIADPEGAYEDPSHLASELLRVDPTHFCLALARRLQSSGARDRDWGERFREAEARSQWVLERELAGQHALLSPRAVRELAQALPEPGLLYVSNSMPVRDLDAFLPVSTRSLRVLCNRGANGIDGMLSCAAGAAAAGPESVVLLTGDLAFVHDAGGLLAAGRHGLSLVVVVVNDEGGGIFSYLPVAEHAEAGAFEELFRVRHGADLGELSRGYGASHVRAGSWEHFRAAVKEGLASAGVSVVELPVDRDRNVAHHRELQRAVAASLVGLEAPA